MSFLARQFVIEEILARVVEYTGVPLLAILGTDRTQDVARARMFAAWLIRRLVGISYAAIGRRLGGRNHSTIVYAIRAVEAVVTEDVELREFAVRVALVVGRKPIVRDLARALLVELPR